MYIYIYVCDDRYGGIRYKPDVLLIMMMIYKDIHDFVVSLNNTKYITQCL